MIDEFKLPDSGFNERLTAEILSGKHGDYLQRIYRERHERTKTAGASATSGVSSTGHNNRASVSGPGRDGNGGVGGSGA